MAPLWVAYVLSVCSLVLASVQTPILPHEPAKIHTARLSTLAAAQHDEFASFSHPSFPYHGLRVKKIHDFCDPTVNAYAGYLDVISAGPKHLFFWFFESRSDPQNDDVIMWINGGPGGSSAMGAFMELGPCNINMDPKTAQANRTIWNPHSWTSKANVFFLEQPVGVGWSYADYGQHVSTTPEAARDVNAFVTMFFDVFDEFKGRALHLAGESFGGRYIPLFASEIYDGRSKAIKEQRTPINLRSVMIGNGLSSPPHVLPSTYDIVCTTASGHPPVLGIDACVQIRKALPYCERMLEEGCVDHLDLTECSRAFEYCDGLTGEHIDANGINRFDVRRKCDGNSVTCYAESDAIEEWLNLNTTRKQLGVPPSAPPYEGVSFKVNGDFAASGDEFITSEHHVAALLERGIRVLLYVGVTDAACPWVGNQRFANALDWSGHEAFSKAPTREWGIPRESESFKKAGTIKSANGLTFVTVDDAGHMVPHDRPEESLYITQAWLQNELA